MATPIISQTQNQAGLCPHGLVPSMCPICSKMMGSMKKKDKPQPQPIKTTEWSYMKCYVEGLRLRSAANKTEHRKLVFERQIQILNEMSFKISNFIQKLQNKIENLPPLAKPVINIVFNFVLKPILTLIAKIPKIISKIIDFQQNLSKFTLLACEKLASFFGEIKNFLKRNKEETIKKRLKDVFKLFQKQQTITVGESNNDTNEQN